MSTPKLSPERSAFLQSERGTERPFSLYREDQPEHWSPAPPNNNGRLLIVSIFLFLFALTALELARWFFP
jgi:tRNA U34 5-methylaminomethyl-2-thiouridine-forming methyltransferase MnmC